MDRQVRGHHRHHERSTVVGHRHRADRRYRRSRKFVLAAIESGASVVTANKALLAKYGPEIYAAAEAKGVDIYFEASVGGAIPFLKPLRESLVGDKVTSMLGIVNGTTNYILDEMTTKGLDFDDVLKDAQPRLCRSRPDRRHRRL